MRLGKLLIPLAPIERRAYIFGTRGDHCRGRVYDNWIILLNEIREHDHAQAPEQDKSLFVLDWLKLRRYG